MRTNGTTRRWLLTAGVLAAGASIGGVAQVTASTRPAPADAASPTSIDPTQVYGSHPDVSDDGRWVVSDGLPTDDCEIWGVLPDEFRAAAADILE